ncbi:DUF1496 domain-containing protein [Pseudoalteromonas spongiae]|uniref:DUF1496 domain-containing protein n=1 Tax=Pseudoalteromonas spongiae TaxID=298657 RepID=UPI00110B17BE|nr:DUF1496 domain-containing protein [Pseudoalteromonas spongiae]TMO82751.1 hypothetical protein CWC15_17830 [Pseudoalteromonas spongiae]
MTKTLTVLAFSAAFASFTISAEVKKQDENTQFCYDDKQHKYSQGAVLKSEKVLRCVYTYDKPSDTKKLAWVEIVKADSKYSLAIKQADK